VIESSVQRRKKRAEEKIIHEFCLFVEKKIQFRRKLVRQQQQQPHAPMDRVMAMHVVSLATSGPVTAYTAGS
jgi:hypothetical protein